MRGPQFCLALIQSSHFYLGVTIRMKAQLFRSIESSLRLFTSPRTTWVTTKTSLEPRTQRKLAYSTALCPSFRSVNPPDPSSTSTRSWKGTSVIRCPTLMHVMPAAEHMP